MIMCLDTYFNTLLSFLQREVQLCHCEALLCEGPDNRGHDYSLSKPPPNNGVRRMRLIGVMFPILMSKRGGQPTGGPVFCRLIPG